MPHYKDGQVAVVGDLVKGVGYNIKDKHGNPRVIVGEVVGIEPMGAACNIRVATLAVSEVPLLVAPIANGVHWGEKGKKYALIPVVEYGETTAFELIDAVTVPAFVEAHKTRLRPIMSGAALMAACKACATYTLYRERDGKKEGFGASEMVDVLPGDRFLCVPPATW